MRQLVARFGRAVKGVLTGFDRIVFKGTILPLAHEEGAMSFLHWRGVLNRDYKNWMQTQTEALVKAVSEHTREQTGKPITPLSTWRHDKEQLARKRQEQNGIQTGLIGAWSCLESCWSYRAQYCAEKGYPQLRRYTTQCKHLYLYLDHEQYGWMNVRLQIRKGVADIPLRAQVSQDVNNRLMDQLSPILANRRFGQSFVHGSRKSCRYPPADL